MYILITKQSINNYVKWFINELKLHDLISFQSL